MVATPRFWSRPLSLPALALAPFGMLYGLASAARLVFARPFRADVPVLCIGNFTAGGTGKTPTVIALAQFFTSRGRTPCIISRGYGGTRKGPHRVELASDTAEDVGDEPWLMARHAPVIIGADRAASARLAVAQGADLVIMDDGMQNPGLAKDMSIALVDAGAGTGNGLIIPAGPLRGFLAFQLSRIDAVLAIGAGDAGADVMAQAQARGLQTAQARIVPAPHTAYLRGQRVLGFCGIGRPEKFLDTLRGIGAEVAVFRAFPDHHAFTPQEAMDLVRMASEQGLTLVTTEKDQARLMAAPHTRAQLAGLANAVPISIQPDDPAFFAWIADRLGV